MSDDRFMWQPMQTVPRNGQKVLFWIEFDDADPVRQVVLGHWQDDAHGFCIKCGDEGGGWHLRGARFWAPLPLPPICIDDLSR